MMGARLLIAALLTAQLAQPGARDADLEQGITFVANGDFSAAEKVLNAVTAKLEGEPGRMRDLADAYLYLGIAQLEQDRFSDAARNFFEARRRNRTLTLSKYQFSAQVMRAFDEAIRAGGVLPADPVTPTPPPAATPAEEWIVTGTNQVTLRMSLGTEEDKCDGAVILNVTAKQLSWSSPQSGPCESFSVPMNAVRPAAAAAQGGVLLAFVNDARPRMLLMPAPSAGYYEDGVAGLSRDDLDPDAHNQIRLAIRRLNQFIEGGSGTGINDILYGVAVDASIAELMDTPGVFAGSAVRTRGQFEIISRDRNQYLLTAAAFTVLIRPDPEAGIAALLRSEARDLRGQQVEVTGAFTRRSISGVLEKGAPEYEVQFWRYDTAAPVEEPTVGRKMTIEELVTADPAPTSPVTVIGKFRGGNLYGDLPYGSRKRPGDWIIKDDLYSIWVTGKSPDGDDWRLSPRSMQDTTNWMRVSGTARVENGFVYLQALAVALSRPPSPDATVGAPPSPRPVSSADAAEIMFTMPIQGIEMAAPDTMFMVQFTKPMDARSFEGRVRLRYARSGGESTFANAAIGYNQVRRVLTIDPGEALVDGRVLECVLLPGIRDSEGVELRGVPGRSPQDPLEILRWTIAKP